MKVPHYIAVYLDDKRLEQIRGTPVEEKVTEMFGGQLKAIIVEVPEEKSREILKAFEKARIDSRGFVEDVPVAFRRVLFEEIAKAKSTDVIDAVLARLPEIQEMAKKEDEYLPPPDIEVEGV
ncbi:MAG: hypothetical protein ABWW66_01075 [Archaeoglobaceae archaeon]